MGAVRDTSKAFFAACPAFYYIVIVCHGDLLARLEYPEDLRADLDQALRSGA